MQKPLQKLPADAQFTEPRLPIATNLEIPAPQGNESSAAYLKRVFADEKLIKVRIRQRISDKTPRAEVSALNALIHPKGADIHPGPGSIEKYKYLLRFDRSAVSTLDLFQRFKALGILQQTPAEAPGFVRGKFDRLDTAKKEAFGQLQSISAGVSHINGVAGCGKSTLLECITLAMFYGELGPDVTVKDAEPVGRKILYVVNNNDGLDTFASNVVEMQQDLGLGHPIDVIRLYSMDSEVETMAKKGKAKPPPDSFKDEDAKKAVVSIDEVDHFTAAVQLAKLELQIHQARSDTRAQKSKCRNLSLAQAASEFYLKNKDGYTDITKAIEATRGSTKPLAPEDMTKFKTDVKALYADFLCQFKGLVCATPVACSNHTFRSTFKPDLVLVDEVVACESCRSTSQSPGSTHLSSPSAIIARMGRRL